MRAWARLCAVLDRWGGAFAIAALVGPLAFGIAAGVPGWLALVDVGFALLGAAAWTGFGMEVERATAKEPDWIVRAREARERDAATIRTAIEARRRGVVNVTPLLPHSPRPKKRRASSASSARELSRRCSCPCHTRPGLPCCIRCDSLAS